MFMLVRKGVVQLLDMKSERGMVVSRSRDLLQSFARLPQHRRQNCPVLQGSIQVDAEGLSLDRSYFGYGASLPPMLREAGETLQ